MTAHVYPDDKAAAAISMVQPDTGRILAMGAEPSLRQRGRPDRA